MKALKENGYINSAILVAVTLIVMLCSLPAWSDSTSQQNAISSGSKTSDVSGDDDSSMVPKYGRGGGGARASAPRVAPRPVSRPSYSAPRVSRPVSQPRYTAPRVSRTATQPSRTSVRTQPTRSTSAVRTQPTRPTTPTSVRTQPVRPTTSSAVRTQPIHPTSPISSVGRHPITPTTPPSSGFSRRPPSSVSSTGGRTPAVRPSFSGSGSVPGKPNKPSSSSGSTMPNIFVDRVGPGGIGPISGSGSVPGKPNKPGSGLGSGGIGTVGRDVVHGGDHRVIRNRPHERPPSRDRPHHRGDWDRDRPHHRRGDWVGSTIVSIVGTGFIPIPVEPDTVDTDLDPVTVVNPVAVEPPSAPSDPCARIRRDNAAADPGDLNQKGMEEFDRNNLRTALCWFELALKRLEAAGRTEEPLTVNVLENLAKTYEALGKREDAASVSYRASALRERLKM